ncbi:MAG: hypothetical protein IPL26_04245 [Leptospiraceae bacterium]|nr:hypothetical protein [Leptospiraceae bacterium]
MKIVCLVLLFFFNCAYQITESEVQTVSESEPLLIRFYSSDQVLVDIICDSLVKAAIGSCVPTHDLSSNEKIKDVYIETQIKESSSDYFLSAGKSLLSLTFGVFLTNSAKVDFIFYVENSKETLLENTNLASEGRTGYWGVLPFYTGFIATNVGTLLNSYRRPDHLQKYCLYESPDKIRQVLEANKEEYCKDYKLFLKTSFIKVQSVFFQHLQETTKDK